MRKAVRIGDTVYPSLTLAALALGCCKLTVKRRIQDGKYPWA